MSMNGNLIFGCKVYIKRNAEYAGTMKRATNLVVIIIKRIRFDFDVLLPSKNSIFIVK